MPIGKRIEGNLPWHLIQNSLGLLHVHYEFFISHLLASVVPPTMGCKRNHRIVLLYQRNHFLMCQ